MAVKYSQHKKKGLPPGTYIHVGQKYMERVQISALDYDEEKVVEKDKLDASNLEKFKSTTAQSWINLVGLHDVPTIEQVGGVFEIHPLVLEDVLNTNNRSKFLEFDHYLFLALKMYRVENDHVIGEHISFVLGKSWLITFQEKTGDVFDLMRSRIKEGAGLVRKRKIDYLFYRLIDTIVDHYFDITDYFSEKTDVLEKKVISGETDGLVREINQLKQELIQFKKSIGPLRETIFSLTREEYAYIDSSTYKYLRDVHEHLTHVLEEIEIQKEQLLGIMDQYGAAMSNKTNQVMQFLTIIATIFIPPTFVAGVYGMNFANMPELHYSNGYFVVLGVMLLMIIALLFYFKKKNWL